jgi:DNA invertase Pin-like site-specific DNA recombinase
LSRKVGQSLFGATTCFVGKLARLGRDPRHLVNAVHYLTARDIGFKVLTGRGASIFAALAEFERTKAGIAAARGRNGGRPQKMASSKLRLAVASMNQPGTRMGDLCAELDITLLFGR